VRRSRGVYDQAMRYEDDAAFQRAILANPSDTTLKLVYADWLQDRADPRADYIRMTMEFNAREVSNPNFDPLTDRELLRELRKALDPAWVAFMNTFAQPFTPGGFCFGEGMGSRGTIWHFESQYRDIEVWSGTLIEDVTFIDATFGPDYDSEEGGIPGGGFLCDFPASDEPFTASRVLSALKASGEYYSNGLPVQDRCFIHQDYEAQRMMYYEAGEMQGEHGKLKRYVTDRQLWYLNFNIEELPEENEYFRCNLAAVLTIGRSPHGNRLVGAIGFPIKRYRRF
jgi:uncharacterized protein (TIGR02996 family)